jgi:hypothetical protein
MEQTTGLIRLKERATLTFGTTYEGRNTLITQPPE